MPIYTYWGPAGSYKTSTAILDECIPAIQKGRLIVTNIRGLQPDRVLSVFGNPNNISLEKAMNNFIHIGDISLESSRERLRYFYEWLPKGAMLVIDEGQSVFRKEVVLKNYTHNQYLKAFIDQDKLVQQCLKDFPDNVWFRTNIETIKQNFLQHIGDSGDIEEESDKWIEYARSIRGRPLNLLDAFDMHRHHGWDIILTMPQIADLHPRVRGLLEDAFSHKNLGKFGLGGRYIQKVHDGRTNANNPSDTRTRKIDDRVFYLYQSTATGQFSDVKKTSTVVPWQVYVLGTIVLGLVFYVMFYGDFSLLKVAATGDLSKLGENAREEQKQKDANKNNPALGGNSGSGVGTDGKSNTLPPSPSPLRQEGSPPSPVDAKANKTSTNPSISTKQTPNASRLALSEYAQAHRQAAPALRGTDSGIRFVRLANYDVPEALVTRFLYVAGVMSVGSEYFYLFAFDTPDGWKLLKQRDFDVSGLLIRPDVRGRSDIYEVLNESGKILGKITRPPYGWEVNDKPRQQGGTPTGIFNESINQGLGGKALTSQVSNQVSPAQKDQSASPPTSQVVPNKQ